MYSAFRNSTGEASARSRFTPYLGAALASISFASVTLGGRAEAASWFGSFGSAAGQFSEPNGIAVDQENGNIYIVDANNERLEKFTKNGTFVLATGWGVADGRTAASQTCTAASGCFAGLKGTGAGEFGFAEGVAVDNDRHSSSHHDAYVVDISHARVEKFSSTGRFLLMFGRQVNQSAQRRNEAAGEDVCPVRRGDRCRAGTAGPGAGQFDFQVEGNFIAVGSQGTVYVGDLNRIEEFDPQGAYTSEVKLTPQPPEGGGTIVLAVDPAGNMYTARQGVSGVQEYTPQGRLEQTLNEGAQVEELEGPTPNIALGPPGLVFLDYHANGVHQLLEYEGSGLLAASFDLGMEDGLHGLAYGDATGKLYIVNTNNNLAPALARVRIITPPRLASSVFQSFAILGGLSAR
jgi:DNA-binding beta-propeller fold protein YncE